MMVINRLICPVKYENLNEKTKSTNEWLRHRAYQKKSYVIQKQQQSEIHV